MGSTILDRYTIRRLIAAGGMGVVYEAEQLLGEHHRTVAIKMLRSELSHDQMVVSRFNRECGIVAQLSHQNTVRVFDFGTAEDGTLYIAMEFIRGQSLADVIGGGPLGVERALFIVEQMCYALHEAHELGIVHRDLKPDNVILTHQGAQPDFVKLLDFGIAVRLSAGGQHETKLTQLGMILGTPPYMSPEQFTGAPVTRQSDIYSLGIILYEILTGHLPFVADNPWMWAQRHLTSIAPELPSTFPAPIVATVRAALAKDPAERPKTTLEMYRLLLGDSGIENRGPEPGHVTTQPDAPALVSTAAERPVGEVPIAKTDDAGPAIMTNGAPFFAGLSATLPQDAKLPGVSEYQSHLAPPTALHFKGDVSRQRGALIGIVLAIGLLLSVGGLSLAYWLGAISNPFESDQSANSLPTSIPNSQMSAPNASPTQAPQVTTEIMPTIPTAISDQPKEPSNPRARTAPAQRGAASAAPSSTAAPSAAASAPPSGITWPPLLSGLPTNLPSLPSRLPPLPTSIAGIPIPPLFPGEPANPAPSPSNDSVPPGP